ncbi:MAG: IS4 family transposase [Steroidobacteraceae bacterium]
MLKSGRKVEDFLLEEATRLKRYLTLFSIIAVRLMKVTYRSRAQPEAPATEVFSPEEIEALHVRVHKKLPPEPPTLRDTVRLVSRLGAHLGRKGDGEPGVRVLWRGWLRLYEDVEILRAHKQALGLSSS